MNKFIGYSLVIAGVTAISFDMLLFDTVLPKVLAFVCIMAIDIVSVLFIYLGIEINSIRRE